jgi:hypothetical protein
MELANTSQRLIGQRHWDVLENKRLNLFGQRLDFNSG